MSQVAGTSQAGKRLGKRFGMLVSQWPWCIVIGLYSISIPISYVAFARDFTPVTLVIGLVLLVLNCYSWALLVKPLQAVRPPAYVVRLGKTCCLLGLLVWVASVLLVFEVAWAKEQWILSDAVLQRETQVPLVAGPAEFPSLQVRLKPSLPPLFMLCSPSVSIACGRGFSSRTLYWPTWGLVVSSVLPTLVLVHLRGERIGTSRCRDCGYDLTANRSGMCPECGTPYTAAVAEQD